MAAKKRRQYRVAPPLEPLFRLSVRLGMKAINYSLTPPADPMAELQETIASPVAKDLSTRTHGNFDDVLRVHSNLALASHILRAMLQDLFTHARALRKPPELRRLVISARLIHDAMLYADAALVLHLRAETKAKPALALARSALETAARGGWVALGVGDEPDRYHHAPFIADRQERKATEVRPSECLERIASVVAKRWPEADAPGVVYGWLCAFTHHDTRAVFATPSASDVYASLAYATTVAALMAEIVIGQGDVVSMPRMPPDLPWRNPWAEPEPLP